MITSYPGTQLVDHKQSRILQQLGDLFPTTLLGAAARLIGIKIDDFIQYIACPLCHSVYNRGFGCVIENGQRIPNKCTHVTMAKHHMASQRQPCGGILMKTVAVKGNSGVSVTLQPNKLFSYQSVISALTVLLVRKNFLDCCEHWRARPVLAPNQLTDIYDGEVWKSFLVVDFLKARHNLCLTLNVDWFQPFIHTCKLASYIYNCDHAYYILAYLL